MLLELTVWLAALAGLALARPFDELSTTVSSVAVPATVVGWASMSNFVHPAPTSSGSITVAEVDPMDASVTPSLLAPRYYDPNCAGTCIIMMDQCLLGGHGNYCSDYYFACLETCTRPHKRRSQGEDIQTFDAGSALVDHAQQDYNCLPDCDGERMATCSNVMPGYNFATCLREQGQCITLCCDERSSACIKQPFTPPESKTTNPAFIKRQTHGVAVAGHADYITCVECDKQYAACTESYVDWPDQIKYCNPPYKQCQVQAGGCNTA